MYLARRTFLILRLFLTRICAGDLKLQCGSFELSRRQSLARLGGNSWLTAQAAQPSIGWRRV
jgi:hypothetical protein